MSASIEHVRFGDSRLGGLIEGARSGNTLLWRTVVAMAMGSLLMFALQFVDARLINGVNIWDKPAKFFLSLAVQYGTVSWALSLLPLAERATRWVRWPVVLMLIAGWGEMAYMIFRASRGEASHFNTSSFGAALGYSLMGVGAVTLTVTAAIIGWISLSHSSNACQRSFTRSSSLAGVAFLRSYAIFVSRKAWKNARG